VTDKEFANLRASFSDIVLVYGKNYYLAKKIYRQLKKENARRLRETVINDK
jgi:hypothetical protein